ncbi:hypothetical protein ACHHYP_08122 [Achlya hypogyna]|uniref:Transmembrane protein n=1 Tax=Achlya hypogyna TaxID=1202772 RepID=A0A1V9YPS6_ACHHY|nr:hypothetical protein ACHHYP_08122 [Achlya hypogyna]
MEQPTTLDLYGTGKRSYPLHRHRIAALLSVVSFFSVSSMPLAAYLSESLPWQGQLTTAPIIANYTEFRAQSLSRFRRAYNNTTLPLGATYFVDSDASVQLARQTVRLGQAPTSTDVCFGTRLRELPGLIFYTPAHIDLLCQLLVAPDVSAVNWEAQGVCLHNMILLLDLGHTCMWLTPGDAVRNVTDAHRATLYFAYAEARYATFVWGKLLFRVATTAFVWRRLWCRYYRHCAALERLVRANGHRWAMPAGNWHYELLLGDSTAIVLIDPWIAFAYFLDVWSSCSTLSMVVVQLAQAADVWLMLLSTVYLARMVWFAYWGLCLTSFALKRLRKEHIFEQVDPTLLALAATVYGPALTYALAAVPALTRFYEWLLICGVPDKFAGHANDGTAGSAMLTVLVATIPLGYGFLAPHFCRRPPPAADVFASYRYNNFKNRAAFWLLTGTGPGVVELGGGVHAALHADPRLRVSPTISWRAADCFLLCYCDGQLHEKLRVSLTSALDMARVPISSSPTKSAFVVDKLKRPPQPLITVVPTCRVAPLTASYTIEPAMQPSAWCM